MPLSSLRGVIILLCGFAFVSSGCLISTPEREPVDREPSVSPHLAPARELYETGRYEDSLMKLVEIGHRHPQAAGLEDLRYQVLTALTESREQNLLRDSELSRRRINLDTDRHKVLPQTYGMRRYFPGETGSLRTVSGRAQQMLEQPVVFDRIERMTLGEFLLQIAASEGINLIADNRLLEDDLDPRLITVHADQGVPLHEILDYVGRNFNVAFYAGDNLIWATERPADEPDAPLETRLYRLRKSVSGHELTDDGLGIERAIGRFVTPPEGFARDEWWLFDRKAHVLIVRNTRENLVQVEKIIEHLDICPPQVSIEALFVSIADEDMQELGIDWMLESPLTLTRKTVTQDGRVIDAPRTQVDEGASFAFTPSMSETGQGLGLTYRGLLTDPMFRAVMHALQLSDKARTLSAPKVTTVNNREAVIRVGDDFLYFETYEAVDVKTGTDNQGHPIYSTYVVPEGPPTLREIGYELTVTPSVGADLESITLNLRPVITEFRRYESYDVARTVTRENDDKKEPVEDIVSIRLPIFRESRIETEVIARSGETVVMGGLITQRDQAYEKRVPIISSIPLLGHLFRSDGIMEEKQNLLIFVTAKLISQRGKDLLPMQDIGLSTEESIRREFFPVSVQMNADSPSQRPSPPQFQQPPENIDFE